MNDPWAEICEAVLSYAENKPVEQRVRLMRNVADYAGDEAKTADLRKRAAQLEAAHNACLELRLQFEKEGQS